MLRSGGGRLQVRHYYGGTLQTALQASGPSVVVLSHNRSIEALSRIEPTGKNGRFTKADFLRTPTTTTPIPSVPSGARLEDRTTVSTALVRPSPVLDFTTKDTGLLRAMLKSMSANIEQPRQAKGENSPTTTPVLAATQRSGAAVQDFTVSDTVLLQKLCRSVEPKK